MVVLLVTYTYNNEHVS